MLQLLTLSRILKVVWVISFSMALALSLVFPLVVILNFTSNSEAMVPFSSLYSKIYFMFFITFIVTKFFDSRIELKIKNSIITQEIGGADIEDNT